MAPPLSSISEWPVGEAAAAMLLPDGSAHRVGPTDHSFRLASVTKPLVAMAVLVAVEEGTLDLDEPAGPASSTVRHLLAHASGLAPDADDVLAEPGTRRIYSNRGFEVLGAQLEQRSGIPVSEYVRDAVLVPLGMSSTRLDGSPAHGATGTVDDLVAFAAELLSPRPTVLAPATRDLAVRVAWPGLPGVLPGFGPQEHNDWGLGVEVRDGKAPHWTPEGCSPRTFGHFGRSGSLLWVDPDARAALVVLCDREFGEWAPPRWRALGEEVLAACRDDFSPDRQQQALDADGERAVDNQGSTP